MSKGESALRIPDITPEQKRYTTKELEAMLAQSTGDTLKEDVPHLSRLQRQLRKEEKQQKETGYIEHIKADRERIKELREKKANPERDKQLLEEGRRRLGGFIGEKNHLDRLQTELRLQANAEKMLREPAPEQKDIELGPEEFEEIPASEEKEWRRRGYITADHPPTPPPLPKRPESKIHQVYGGKIYPTVTGVGTISSVEPSGVLRHYTGRKSAEMETVPEMTNEEAVEAYLDRDIENKTSGKQLLNKLLSEKKIYLDKEENTGIILNDDDFLAALGAKKWGGDLVELARIASEVSINKSDKLTEMEEERQKKSFFKRMFSKIAGESPEKMRVEKQMFALDDLIRALAPGGKSEPTSPDTKRLLNTMSKR